MKRIKAIIKTILPKYISFKKENASIVVIGIRRGGTTLLSSLLSTKYTRIIDQPLEAFNRNIFSRILNFKKKRITTKRIIPIF